MCPLCMPGPYTQSRHSERTRPLCTTYVIKSHEDSNTERHSKGKIAS